MLDINSNYKKAFHSCFEKNLYQEEKKFLCTLWHILQLNRGFDMIPRVQKRNVHNARLICGLRNGEWTKALRHNLGRVFFVLHREERGEEKRNMFDCFDRYHIDPSWAVMTFNIISINCELFDSLPLFGEFISRHNITFHRKWAEILAFFSADDVFLYLIYCWRKGDRYWLFMGNLFVITKWERKTFRKISVEWRSRFSRFKSVI